MFLNAFGIKLQTLEGVTFKGILEVIPFTLGNGFIEGEETYCTARKSDVTSVTINSVLVINNKHYVVYNIIDDLSGMVDIYYRDEKAQHFAEDY
ncbi:hypothetical protein DMS60_20010 [Klebsiella variicola]|nr:hypothetical protein DMS60_20010 [Klebsiella variicola]